MRISGGEFKGSDTAIEIRAGKINIADGKFISTSAVYSCESNGNGATTAGVAIAIAQHTTKLPITVGIDGGEFSGYHAISEDNHQNNDPASLNKIQLQINNGNLKSTNTADDKAAIYSKDLSKFISGGTFNTVPSPAGKEYTADNTSIEHISGSDEWTVTSIVE